MKLEESEITDFVYFTKQPYATFSVFVKNNHDWELGFINYLFLPLSFYQYAVSFNENEGLMSSVYRTVQNLL